MSTLFYGGFSIKVVPRFCFPAGMASKSGLQDVVNLDYLFAEILSIHTHEKTRFKLKRLKRADELKGMVIVSFFHIR